MSVLRLYPSLPPASWLGVLSFGLAVVTSQLLEQLALVLVHTFSLFVIKSSLKKGKCAREVHDLEKVLLSFTKAVLAKAGRTGLAVGVRSSEETRTHFIPSSRHALINDMPSLSRPARPRSRACLGWNSDATLR
jgi:hypothetical protein